MGEYCRKTTNKKLCVQLVCEKDKAKTTVMSYQSFPSSKGLIIGICRADNKYPYVFRCEAGFEAVLDEMPIVCKVKCTKSEKIADPTDPYKYYQCSLNGRIWESKLKNCYPYEIFDSKAKKCVKE